MTGYPTTSRRGPLESQWIDALDMFMAAYTVAAESAMGVPEEIYAIAPLAAKYLDRYGMATSNVAQALLASAGGDAP